MAECRDEHCSVRPQPWKLNVARTDRHATLVSLSGPLNKAYTFAYIPWRVNFLVAGDLRGRCGTLFTPHSKSEPRRTIFRKPMACSDTAAMTTGHRLVLSTSTAYIRKIYYCACGWYDIRGQHYLRLPDSVDGPTRLCRVPTSNCHAWIKRNNPAGTAGFYGA